MPVNIDNFTISGSMIEDTGLGGIVTDGLVLHLDAAYKHSYPMGGTTWYDLSGNGSNGTLVNGATFDSANGGSIAFDATNEYITVPSSNNFAFGTGDFTLEMWIYPQSFSTYPHMIALPNQNTFALKANIGSGEIYFYSPSFTTYPTTGWILRLNTWNHVVFARQSSVSYPYLNGIGYATKSGFTTNFTAQVLNIHNGWPNEFAQCKIASTKIYNRALSASEILQNFNANRRRFGV